MQLRDLARCAKARQRTDWDHTASVLSLHANLNRDSKKRSQPYQPAEFHPLRSGEGPRPVSRERLAEMREACRQAQESKK